MVSEGVYHGDLNHYLSGLAALQMCAIAKDLAEEDTWEDAFNDEREAREQKGELLRAFDQLKISVALAVKEAKKRLFANTDDLIWANISNADLLFLTEEKKCE